MSCKIKWGVTSCWWEGYHHEEGVTTIKRTMKRRRGSPWLATPWGCPSSPIKGPPLIHVHACLILTLSRKVAAPNPSCLAKLCRIVSSSFTHLEKWVLECSADPFFHCPAGPRAWRRRRQAVRVTEYGGAASCGAVYTISWSSSEPLRRLRQVNDYVDYVHLPRLSIGNICAGT
jgi:hypothetical protein